MHVDKDHNDFFKTGFGIGQTNPYFGLNVTDPDFKLDYRMGSQPYPFGITTPTIYLKHHDLFGNLFDEKFYARLKTDLSDSHQAKVGTKLFGLNMEAEICKEADQTRYNGVLAKMTDWTRHTMSFGTDNTCSLSGVYNFKNMVFGHSHRLKYNNDDDYHTKHSVKVTVPMGSKSGKGHTFDWQPWRKFEDTCNKAGCTLTASVTDNEHGKYTAGILYPVNDNITLGYEQQIGFKVSDVSTENEKATFGLDVKYDDNNRFKGTIDSGHNVNTSWLHQPSSHMGLTIFHQWNTQNQTNKFGFGVQLL
jgi:hypothetical protein